jgi:hypothetical protein
LVEERKTKVSSETHKVSEFPILGMGDNERRRMPMVERFHAVAGLSRITEHREQLEKSGQDRWAARQS